MLVIGKNFLNENLLEIALIGFSLYLYKEKPYYNKINIRKYMIGIIVLAFLSIVFNNLN